jgi:raffinose/stachyose/melibiose transport system permease protein
MNIPQVRSDLSKWRQRVNSPRRVQDYLTIFLFLLPAFVIFLLFIIYPIFRAVYFSLFNWNGMGPATVFVGLNNFKQILTDHVFIKAVANCILIVVLSITLQLPFALMLAIMVGRDLPGRAFFRVIFFLPYVLSEVITAIIWMGLFSPDPERGFINALLVLIPGAHAQNFLGDINQVMACVFIVLTWKYFGL